MDDSTSLSSDELKKQRRREYQTNYQRNYRATDRCKEYQKNFHREYERKYHTNLQRYHNKTPEKKQQIIQYNKQWLQQLPPEKQKEYKDNHREASLNWYHENKDEINRKRRERYHQQKQNISS